MESVFRVFFVLFWLIIFRCFVVVIIIIMHLGGIGNQLVICLLQRLFPPPLLPREISKCFRSSLEKKIILNYRILEDHQKEVFYSVRTIMTAFNWCVTNTKTRSKVRVRRICMRFWFCFLFLLGEGLNIFLKPYFLSITVPVNKDP